MDKNVDNGNNQEKLFTQEEVDSIIRKRLERYKANEPAKESKELEEREEALIRREKELEKRSFSFDCRDYLRMNGYDSSFIDLITADSLDEFKDKADKLHAIIEDEHRQSSAFVAPAFTSPFEVVKGSPISEAFSPERRHEPKQFDFVDNNK